MVALAHNEDTLSFHLFCFYSIMMIFEYTKTTLIQLQLLI